MSRVISFRDLRLIPELSKFNEVELLHPNQDRLVAKYLEQLGFNTNAPVEYVPNKHRDMQGAVAVGFRAVGTINTDSPFLKTKLASMEDRLMAIFFKDPSFARELAQMMNVGVTFGESEDLLGEDFDEFTDDQIEPDYEEKTEEIKRLEELRDSIRGPMYNEAGAPKTYKEYAQYVADQWENVSA